jgi:hypothetical protein
LLELSADIRVICRELSGLFVSLAGLLLEHSADTKSSLQIQDFSRELSADTNGPACVLESSLSRVILTPSPSLVVYSTNADPHELQTFWSSLQTCGSTCCRELYKDIYISFIYIFVELQT